MALSMKIEGINGESQELVDMYLQANEKSARTIISALRRLIEETKKSDITDINYKDYISYVKPFENDKTPAKLKREFIKFLYGYGFLKDKSGFENEYWNPKEITENFEKENKQRDKEKYKAVLTFEQIEKIQQFGSVNNSV